MKLRLLIAAFFFVFSPVVYSQSPVLNWEYSYNGSANGNDKFVDMVVKSNGEVFVTGSTEGSGIHYVNYLTIRVDANGTQAWADTFNGASSLNDEAKSIDLDGLEEFLYVTGKSQGNLTGNDWATLQYNTSGSRIWSTKTYDFGNLNDEAQLVKVLGNNIFISGWYTEITSGDFKKVFKWEAYNQAGVSQGGFAGASSTPDMIHDFILGSNGKYYFAFEEFGELFGDTLKSIIQIAEITLPNFNSDRFSYYGTMPVYQNGDYNFPVKIVQDAAGYFYVAGAIDRLSGAGSNHDIAIFKLKLDASDTTRSIYRYGGSALGTDKPSDMVVDAQGNTYVVGYTDQGANGNDIVLIKLNSSGSEAWTPKVIRGDSIGGDDRGLRIAIAPGNNPDIYIGGYVTDSISNKDIFLSRYSSSGVLEWDTTYDCGNGDDTPTDFHFEFDNSGNLEYIYVSGYNNCSGNEDGIVLKYCFPPTIDFLPASRVICQGESITITASGGVGYEWSTGSISPDITVSPSVTTTYHVTVENSSGCTATKSVTVTVNPLPTVFNVTPPTGGYCPGSSGVIVGLDGSQTGVYYQLKKNGVNQGSPVSGTGLVINFGIQTAETYTVVATSTAGCTNTMAGQAAITTYSLPNPTATSTPNSSCSSPNGTATVTSPYDSIQWNNGQTTNPATGLSAGSYSVTVRDGNGCTGTTSVSIGSSTPNFIIPITVVTHSSSCTGPNNGSASVGTVTGGSAPYSYEWDNGQTTQTATGLSAGIHTVTVTDNTGCTDTEMVTINNNTPTLTVTVNHVTPDTSCISHTGSATVIQSFNSYTWSNGDSAQTATGLSAGMTYTVTVTDSNGCTGTGSVTITGTTPIITIAVTSNTPNTSCDAPNGSLTISASGGVFPYTYQWDADTGNQTGPTASGLNGGTYSVTATDGNGCSGIDSFTIINDNGITLTTNVSCASIGQSNGSIDLTVNGGTPPYTYLWSTGASTQNLDSVPKGLYSVDVEDNSGCSATAMDSVCEGCVRRNVGPIFGPRCIENQTRPEYQINRPGGNVDYTWVVDAPNTIAAEQGWWVTAVNWDTTGQFTLSVIVTNLNTQCQDTASLSVKVASDSLCCPNLCPSDTITSINTIDAQEIKVSLYPNPNTGNFMVELETMVFAEMQISVLNLLGQEVYKSEPVNSIGKYSRNIIMGDAPPGMYFVKIRAGETTISRRLIVAE